MVFIAVLGLRPDNYTYTHYSRLYMCADCSNVFDEEKSESSVHELPAQPQHEQPAQAQDIPSTVTSSASPRSTAVLLEAASEVKKDSIDRAFEILLNFEGDKPGVPHLNCASACQYDHLCLVVTCYLFSSSTHLNERTEMNEPVHVVIACRSIHSTCAFPPSSS